MAGSLAKGAGESTTASAVAGAAGEEHCKDDDDHEDDGIGVANDRDVDQDPHPGLGGGAWRLGGGTQDAVGEALEKSEPAHGLDGEGPTLDNGEGPTSDSGVATGERQDVVRRVAGVWRRSLKGCFSIVAKGAAFVQVPFSALEGRFPASLFDMMSTCRLLHSSPAWGQE